MDDIVFIIGLGNPGKKYKNTRHNVGFIIVEKFIQKLDATPLNDYKFSSIIYTLYLHDKKVIIAMPLTFMNLSGNAVKQIINFYKPPNLQYLELGKKILVVHDDMDLDIGKFKLKFDGGDAGHNGVKSIIQHIGKDFCRLRVGISKPADKNYQKYVLEDFLPEEIIKIDTLIPSLCRVIDSFIREGFDMTVSKIGTIITAGGRKDG
ncbi:MAG: aminoacyl-tRNA hydrolase [bacterium]